MKFLIVVDMQNDFLTGSLKNDFAKFQFMYRGVL